MEINEKYFKIVYRLYYSDLTFPFKHVILTNFEKQNVHKHIFKRYYARICILFAGESIFFHLHILILLNHILN